MSYLDLGTLTMMRKTAMSSRINELTACFQSVIENIKKLNCQAQTFTERLNCGVPSELKTRYLETMRELDEYIYFMTEVNFTIQNFIDNNIVQDVVPVLDVNRTAVPLQPTANLFDMLSEPGSSTSTPSQQLNSERRHEPKLPRVKNEDCLIDFSSVSSSVESTINNNVDNVEGQNEDTEVNTLPIKVEELSLDPPEERIQTFDSTTQLAGTLNLSELSKCALPPQEVLQIDTIYSAYIFNTDDLSIWVITDDPQGLFSEIFARMEEYYNHRTDFVPVHILENLSYCAYFDTDSSTWYRCYILEAKHTNNKAQLYFVDTGKIQIVPNDKLQPLYPEFCTLPPFARTCHLAGIDVEDQSFESLSKVTKFVSQFMGYKCQIEVEDNTSESMACYVRLEDNRTINHMLVESGLAVHIGGECTCNSVQENIMKSQAIPDNQATLVPAVEDITDYPEYEDALVAVTGYHNRDEAEICKHYKGPPYKTCFKGERCKKRHIPMHPDGWTLDKTEVLCKAPTLSLPAPGTVCDVRVTYVLHCNKVYVQFVTPLKPLRHRSFGMMVPPETLEELVRHMNSRAMLPTYRTLKMAPAPGELVAAMYPVDQKWYRARVLTHSPSDQTVEVQYVDYGTEYWVKENLVCELQSVYTHLPFQSVLCTLAEVKLRNQEAVTLAEVKKYLTIIAQDKVHQALIISRSFDELEVVLIDKEGMNIAKKLAETGLVDYEVRKVDIQDSAWKGGKIPPEISSTRYDSYDSFHEARSEKRGAGLNGFVQCGYYATVKPSAVTILGYAKLNSRRRHGRKSEGYYFLSYTGGLFPSILRFFDQHHVTLTRVWKFLPIQKSAQRR